MTDTNRPPLAINGIDLITLERSRQKEIGGWSDEHDDKHDGGELADAAAVYAMIAAAQARGAGVDDFDFESVTQELNWPWDQRDYKPKDQMSNLVRAGALIAAEVDRLLRQEADAAEPQRVERKQVIVDGDAVEHHMMDALTLAGSAIVLMAQMRYKSWCSYQTLLAHAQRNPDAAAISAQTIEEWIARDSAILRDLCDWVNEAMNFIGDCNNGTDLVDEYGMTDAAFAAMRRALSTESTTAADTAGPRGHTETPE